MAVPCCGMSFERKALRRWMRKNGDRCPQSGEALRPSDLKPNTKLQWEILYLERTNSDMDGSQRSPSSSATPVAPVSKMDCPPILPRSPPGCMPLNQTVSFFRRSFSCETTFAARRPMDLPPSQPRSSSSVDVMVRASLKRVDSAPILPRRTDAVASITVNSILLSSLSGAAYPHDCEENSHCGRISVIPPKVNHTNALTTMLEEALAILESEE